MNINKLEHTHIEKLTPDQLAKLLKMLLHLEVLKHNLVGFRYVSQKITTSDGGEDGYIEVNDTGNSTWIKNKLSIFQSKATDLQPNKCKSELLKQKKDKSGFELKPEIKTILDKGGQYILFMSYHPGKRIGLTNRRKQFKEAFNAVGLSYNDDQVIIYDGLNISEWASEYPSTLFYVLECNGITKPALFRTWEQWENDYHASLQYNFEDSNLIDKISELKRLLVNNNSIRVLGHSGIGKTRLVFETLAPKLNDEAQNIINFSVVYYDLGLVSSTDKLIEFIVNNKNYINAIIVIDNCSEENHNTIANIVISNSKIKIISIDFSLETDEKNTVLLTNTEQAKTVDLMLEKLFPNFTPSEKAKISELAEGYPRMVELFKIANSTTRFNLTNPHLPKEFVKKLVFGRNEYDQKEFEIIRACSIFNEFDFVDETVEELITPEQIEKLNEHSRYIANSICMPPVDIDTFYRTCRKFKIERKIIERRGYKYVVVPTPLALHLAADWLLDCSPVHYETLSKQLTNNGLITSFCNRLQSLDQIEKAKNLVARLWGPNGPFVTAEVLNTELGSRLFRSIVEVNPESALDALEYTFINFTNDDFKAFIVGRRNIIWALEKLVFRKNLFERAAKLLSLFAIAENENIANNATGQFIQLFQSFLPGTEANYDSRLSIIDWCLSQSNIKAYFPLAINCMARGLVAHHLHRMGGPEKQGLSTILKDYEPQQWEETYKYWEEIISRLTNIALTNFENRELAMKTIANSIRSLLSFHQSNLVHVTLISISEVHPDVWEEAIRGLKDSLKYESLSEAEITIVNALIEKILPDNFVNKLKHLVSLPHYDSYIEVNGKMEDVSEIRIIEFAKEIIDLNLPLEDYLQNILEGNQCWAVLFGKEIGKSANSESLLYRCFELLKSLPEEKRNPDFIGGLAISIDFEIVNKFIDFVIEDNELFNYAIYLTSFIKPQREQLFKLFKLADSGKIKIDAFSRLTYGRPFERINSSIVTEFCAKISEYGITGIITAFNIIEQYALFDDVKWQECKAFIRSLIFKIGNPVNATIQSIDYYKWSKAISKSLDKTNDFELSTFISELLYNSLGDSKKHSQEAYFSEISIVLMSQYFDTFWKIVSPALISDSIHYLNFKYLFGSHNGHQKREGLLFTNGDLGKVFEWCKTNTPKAPSRLAYMMPIYVIEETHFAWHPFAKSIIDEFGDIDGLMNEVGSNMGSYGWTGSVVPYFEQMQKLAEQLLHHPLIKVKKWAQKTVEYYKKDIMRQRLIDEQLYL